RASHPRARRCMKLESHCPSPCRNTPGLEPLRSALCSAQAEVESAAYLIENQQCSVLVCNILHRLEETSSRLGEIHGLHDHRRELPRVLLQNRSQTGDIVIAES